MSTNDTQTDSKEALENKKDGPKAAEKGRRRSLAWSVLVLAVVAGAWWFVSTRKPPLVIPEGGGVSDWPAYGRDAGGSRYAPLSQITPGNVMHLEQAWVYRTGEDYTGTRQGGQAAFETTPILLDGTLYLSTQTSRVIALDPETGQERWVYDPGVDVSEGTSELTSRGVSAWPQDGRDEPRRIFVATLDARLIALDAASGTPIESFGSSGVVDLTEGIRLDPDSSSSNYVITSPPAIVGDMVIVGSAIGDYRRTDSEQGVVRAYDARTGQQRWAWDPIPRSPEASGWAEWEPEQARITGGANAWSILSADPERDLVFVPTGSATPDYYGGERLGSNLYANCVVALRASTGEIVWHFQIVHHDLWDYDVPSQPTLITMTRDGREVPALVQATKMGHLYFFDRVTGEPMFDIEERPVPASGVPGEAAWPTQPFPVVTPALVPQTLTPEDAWGVTPWDRGWARDRIEELKSNGLFTPPSVQGSIHYPGVAGGTNWGSVAYDPERELVIMNTTRAPFIITLFPREDYDLDSDPGDNVERARQKGTPYIMHREPFLSPLGLPVSPPPWGTLVAVSTVTGKVAWEVTLGTVRDLAPLPLPIKWGTPSMGGPIATESGVIFIAAAMDNYLRAFDTETGAEIWKGRLPAGGQATPMTYRLREDGKQYVVICAGGHGRLGTKLGDYVIAYALPDV